jgi:hypothetical protein
MWGAQQVETTKGLGQSASALGTRFLIYAQVPLVSGYEKPETVWISTPPDRLGPGPEDNRMYVRDPLLDKEPYEFPYLPPFVGESYPPVVAGPDGHFDWLNPRSRQFLAAHAFGCARRVLDIWESYLGHPIVWHFAETYERLEIIPWIEWNNAQSGYGYLELGRSNDDIGRLHPYALNFDVIAHELGHSILFSLIGFPDDGFGGGDFAPFHEACADLISIFSFLHFDSGIDRLLRHCGGNLLILNELNRIAELSNDRQIRLASNARRMSEVTKDVHDYSRPFTGAIFDTLVEEFHALLVEHGLADEQLLSVGVRNTSEEDLRRVSELTTSAFQARPFLFKSALTEARDVVALSLANAWRNLDPNNLLLSDAAAIMSDIAGERLSDRLRENFHWRQIL